MQTANTPNSCCVGGRPAVVPVVDPCFPSSSTVTKADGATIRIDALKEGDVIVAATVDGVLTTDTVSLLSIAKPKASVAAYVNLTTATNAALILTPGHHVPTGEACCSSLKTAAEVMVGDIVWTVDGSAKLVAPVATTITAKTISKASGLHSPVLTHGGFPIVDGVVTAFDSIDKVMLAMHGLAPLLAACKVTDTCEKFREMFLHEVLEYVPAAK